MESNLDQLLNLTIAIPARNEERNLATCLQAIGSDLARHVVAEIRAAQMPPPP